MRSKTAVIRVSKRIVYRAHNDSYEDQYVYEASLDGKLIISARSICTIAAYLDRIEIPYTFDLEDEQGGKPGGAIILQEAELKEIIKGYYDGLSVPVADISFLVMSGNVVCAKVLKNGDKNNF